MLRKYGTETTTTQAPLEVELTEGSEHIVKTSQRTWTTQDEEELQAETPEAQDEPGGGRGVS